MRIVHPCIIALVVLGISSFVNTASSAGVTNLIVNPYFAEGIAGWTLECHDPFVKADIKADPNTKVIGNYSLFVDIREIQPGSEIWRCQPKQTGLALQGGKKYTWSFWAKAAKERQLQCQVLVDVWDWRLLGLDTSVTISTEWKEYFNTFVCTEDYSNARITWLCAHVVVDFWLDNVILYEGDYVEGLMAEQLIKKPSMVTPRSLLTSTWGRAKSEY